MLVARTVLGMKTQHTVETLVRYQDTISTWEVAETFTTSEEAHAAAQAFAKDLTAAFTSSTGAINNTDRDLIVRDCLNPINEDELSNAHEAVIDVEISIYARVK